MDPDSFIIQFKTEDFYKDISGDAKILFDSSNFSEDDNRPLPRGTNKKLIGLMKDELGGKIMIEPVSHRPKPYS